MTGYERDKGILFPGTRRGLSSLPMAAAVQSLPPKLSNAPASEIVVIDGKKNPELIPQWRVWEFAFDAVADATEQTLPTVLYQTTSKDERVFLMKAARAQAGRASSFKKRVLDGTPELLKQPVSVVNEKTRAMNIEYRWTILHARDRVLAGLNPAGQVALTQWVEARKAGFLVRVPKNEMAHYLQPQ